MLRVNHLTGFGAGGAAGITGFGVRDNHVGTVSSTTHTWTGASLGAAAANRVVYVLVSTNNVGGHTSMTIGGVSATEAIEGFSTADTRASIWAAAVPTGTTGDIVLTVADTGTDIMMTAYSANGSSVTAYHTAEDASAPKNTISINVPAGGICLCACMDNIDPTGFVWTADQSITEDYDTDTGAVQMGAASIYPTTLASGINVDIASTPASSNPVIVGASFGVA